MGGKIEVDIEGDQFEGLSYPSKENRGFRNPDVRDGRPQVSSGPTYRSHVPSVRTVGSRTEVDGGICFVTNPSNPSPSCAPVFYEGVGIVGDF